jgi:hypothetical protein
MTKYILSETLLGEVHTYSRMGVMRIVYVDDVEIQNNLKYWIFEMLNLSVVKGKMVVCIASPPHKAITWKSRERLVY